MPQVDPRSAPPRLVKATIERGRLLTRLLDARHKTCLILRGPAGCGKTTLALQWRTRLAPFGFDVAWLTLAPGDDAERLLDRLFAALDQVSPDIAREAAFIYNRDSGTQSPDDLAVPLINGFARHPRHIVLLIDDYQNIGDARAHQVLQALLDFAPAHLHLALVSRSDPPLSLARLRDQDNALELDFQDLRFSLAEAEDFLISRHADLPRREARVIHELTDGWAAGLQLLSLGLKRRPQQLQGEAPVQNPVEFEAFFNREVLSQLSPEDLDALVRLSVPRRFSHALAAALLGPEAGQAAVDRVIRDNLFLLPADGGRESGYRFHPLFRDLLVARFERWPAAQRQRTHAALGEWYAARGDLLDAAKHLIAAGEVEAAADWLERAARAMFLRGELRRLVAVVDELPRTVVASRVSLRLWVAWAQLCYRRLDECHASVQSLRATLPGDDTEARQLLTLLEGLLAIQDDDTAAALRLLGELEAMSPTADAILVGGRRNILGWLYIHLQDFERARQCLTGPRLLLEDGSVLLDSAFGDLTGRCMLGFSYIHAGDIRQAERVLRDVLGESERLLGSFCEPAGYAAGFLSDVLYETNDLAALQALLEPRLDAIERVCLPDSLLRPSLMLSRMHLIQGNRQEAFASLDRLEDQAMQFGLDRVVAHVLAERVRVNLRLHDTAAVEESFAQLRFIAKRQERSQTASRDKIALLVDITQVHFLAASGRDAEAHSLLTGLMAQAPFRGQRRVEVRMSIQMALLDSRLGRVDRAIDEIATSLDLCRRLGLVRAVLDFGDEVLVLAEQARARGRLDPTLAFYVDRLHAHAQAAASSGAVAPTVTGAEVLSHRELEILRAMASAMPNKRIAQAFAISPETVKWHTKNIYGKLGVSGRDGAVAKARDLGLLGTPDEHGPG